MTNRQLLLTAMPLKSLTGKQWGILCSHIQCTEDDEVLDVLETLKINQSRIEVMSNYYDYFHDRMNEEVGDRIIDGLQVM